MRRAAHIDANQPEIVAALRKTGALVMSLAPIGKGVPDLLVYFRGQFLLIEVKNPAKLQGNKERLTPAQKVWHAIWPVVIVESVDEALEACNAR